MFVGRLEEDDHAGPAERRGVKSVTERLPRATAASRGVAADAIERFLDGIARAGLELHSFMLVRHGAVAAEGWWSPYRADAPHMLFSLSKSFTSTAVGLAVADGLLTVDDFVHSFFPTYAPAPLDANLAAMRVRHLLSMSTGHERDAQLSRPGEHADDWIWGFFQEPVVHEPGTHFVYNNGASYMLSAIVQQVTGQTVLDYLGPRVLAPLGIDGATWQTCPRGRNMGGSGLRVKTEDIAKFGLLYLQEGVWKGQRILSQDWVREATRRHVANGDDPASDWAQGYGYQFWRCRHGAYRGDGAFGQFCVIFPEQDAVLAITAGVSQLQGVLDEVFAHLLPGMDDAAAAPASASRGALETRLSGLALPPVGGGQPHPHKVPGARYRIADNEWGFTAVAFAWTEDGCTVTFAKDGRKGGATDSATDGAKAGATNSATDLATDGGTDGATDSATDGAQVRATEGAADEGGQEISCGFSHYVHGTSSFAGRSEPVAASCEWSGSDTLVAVLRFIETPFVVTLTFVFSGETLRATSVVNVSFGAKEQFSLEGRLDAADAAG